VENRPSDALLAIAERTARVDRTVSEAAGTLLFPAVPSGLAMLAVGGYGRRELFPHSDVDLLLLVESERLAYERKADIAAFLQQLWDSGLRVSHSVRTPADCTEVHEGNVELNISLLDQRFLAGDRALYAAVADKFPRFLAANRSVLTGNLARLTRERHARYAGTFYHLEPNVKETPGGLRDHQVLRWLEKLNPRSAGGTPASADLEESFHFLARLRWWLHCQAGRDQNVLSFEAQDAIAGTEVAVADWMRAYFRHARAIFRAAVRALEASEAGTSGLFAQFRDWRGRLANAEFSVHRERAHFRAPGELGSDPALALRLFEFEARHGIRPSLEAEQQIEARLPALTRGYAEAPPSWRSLGGILSLPHAPLAVRSMHDAGVLEAVFPELRCIECLVIRDFYHRYTVDEHSLVAMENLWSLRRKSEEFLHYADLLAEVRDPAVLMFALLFHDAGKGVPGKGPVDASLDLVESAMRRLQMPAPEREAVRFLIGSHLHLSATMQSRDVFDPETIREVAHRVETVERLKALTLITWADISAVHPTAMTPWRAAQLWQLYLAVYNELTRELEEERIGAAPSGPPGRVAFLSGFPTRYLLTHTEAEIDGHMALEERSRARGFAVEVGQADAAWQLTLVAADRPGLFAAVAGTLAGFGMDILRVEAFSNRRGLVLDTFAFADPLRTLELNPSEIDRLRATAERVLAGKTDVNVLLRNRPKPVPPSRKSRVRARVSFNSEASATATLIEIVAEDRPGLLYDVSSAIFSHGGNIEVVLIDTQAHKAIDVFYVTAGGKKLAEERQRDLGEALRRACEPQ
jgi:[protein-PII] uridylyltransferase